MKAIFISYVNINNYTADNPKNGGMAIEIVMVNNKFRGSLDNMGVQNNLISDVSKLNIFKVLYVDFRTFNRTAPS